MPISLFYHYADVGDVEGIADRLREAGTRLKLGGRIRVSDEGINGTLGGETKDVEYFHEIVLREFGTREIDFKISEGNAQHFGNEWRVRVCDEVVTTGAPKELVHWQDAAPHLCAESFRSEVINVLNCGTRETVILDARNEYEHAIGRFDGAILPPIRQFSDFARFIQHNHDLFDGKRVLMYCTGGVRCEKGSVVVKKLSQPQSVVQLQGGIEMFLKKFPSGGGVFRGKNLVFDRRLAVATRDAQVVGICICCRNPWDDYSSNRRCARCRCRVLICDKLDCVNNWVGTDCRGSLCARCGNRPSKD